MPSKNSLEAVKKTQPSNSWHGVNLLETRGSYIELWPSIDNAKQAS